MDSFKDRLKDIADKGVELAGEKMEQRKEDKQEKKAQDKEDKLELAQRIKQMDKDGIVYCPKCYSDSVSANKRGFKFGRAVVGGALTLGVGVMAGAVGKNKIEVTCLKCGNTWKAGK